MKKVDEKSASTGESDNLDLKVQELKNKRVAQKRLNLLKFPIYAVEVFHDYIFLGCGGGYETQNRIQVYRLQSTSQRILDAPVH